MKNTLLVVLFSIICLCCIAQDGTLDITFGNYGTTILNTGGSLVAPLQQADGKIVAAGGSYTFTNSFDFAACRLLSTGILDSSFGQSGVSSTNFQAGGYNEMAWAAVLQPDEKIVLGGAANYDFALVRYNTDGSLDSSFSNDGKVKSDLGEDEHAQAMVLQPDGKIVIAGTQEINTVTNFALQRYNPDGTLDTDFGNSGSVITVFPSNSQAGAMALQSDGKIIVGGWSSNTFHAYLATARYKTNGTLDSTWGGTGIVRTSFSDQGAFCSKLFVLPNGKILSAGYIYSSNQKKDDFMIAQYNSDGSLDSSFGMSGSIITDLGNSDDFCNTAVLQPNGKLILAGYRVTNKFTCTLLRYNVDGSIDSSFGINGRVQTDEGEDFNQNLLGIMLQADGKIVTVGTGGTGGSFVLARYLNSEGTCSITVNASEDTICQKSKSTLTATGASDYVWSPAISLNTSMGDTVVAKPKTSTTYTVTGNSGSCSSTITITVNPVPKVKIAELPCSNHEVQLVANSNPGTGITYQWMKNNMLIAGATDKIYYADVTGNYSCKVTNNVSSCSKKSAPIITTVNCKMSEEESSSFDVAVSPNPSNGSFYVTVAGNSYEPFSIIVYDCVGREVKKYSDLDPQSPFLLNENLDAGFYTLEISQGISVEMKKVIKTQ